MIDGLTIKKVASYDAAGTVIDGLREVNYFFGGNGVGKTTIGRLIASPELNRNSECSIQWRNGNPIRALVYNKDFVDANFSEEIKGIFTLGEEHTTAAKKIEGISFEITAIESDLKNQNGALFGANSNPGKTAERKSLEENFRDACWKVKLKHDDAFAKALEPNRSVKDRFMREVLHQAETNKSNLRELDDLLNVAKTVYAQNPTALPIPSAIDTSELRALTSDELIRSPVIGKADVDIAQLIQRLDISDWVRQGHDHLRKSEPYCPFCQQIAPKQLAEQLANYFDQTFDAKIRTLKSLDQRYKDTSSRVMSGLSAIANGQYQGIDESAFKQSLQALQASIDLNIERLAAKLKEPSREFEFEKIDELLDSIHVQIKFSQDTAETHNAKVLNIDSERQSLRGEVWHYIVKIELNTEIQNYKARVVGLDNAISALTQKIEAGKAKIADLNRQAQELQRSLTSVQPTVIAINGLLTSFGFTSFQVRASDTDHHYHLVRPDGSDARTTLSEGERSFLTFLYFYHLIKGSQAATNTISNLIVVFDDPVSSLDSDVLFIVSSLMRSVISEAANRTGKIQQVFILTHNIYFHKEVSYDPKRGPDLRATETFWLIRKNEGKSKAFRQQKNPVETSYQLLWSEIREVNVSSTSLGNTMRRILESYFKLLGGKDLNALTDLFDGTEKIVCASLMSWINDASHSIHEDLHMTPGPGQTDAYRKVFKDIFYKCNQEGHYLMMMGPEESIGIQPPVGQADSNEPPAPP